MTMITRMKSADAVAGRTNGSEEMRVSAVVIAFRPCLGFASLSTATAKGPHSQRPLSQFTSTA
jgi:hypothetical protein